MNTSDLLSGSLKKNDENLRNLLDEFEGKSKFKAFLQNIKSNWNDTEQKDKKNYYLKNIEKAIDLFHSYVNSEISKKLLIDTYITDLKNIKYCIELEISNCNVSNPDLDNTSNLMSIEELKNQPLSAHGEYSTPEKERDIRMKRLLKYIAIIAVSYICLKYLKKDSQKGLDKRTSTTVPKSVCLVVEEGYEGDFDIPSFQQLPKEITGTQAKGLIRAAHYFSLLPPEEADTQEKENGKFLEGSIDSWNENSTEDIYIRLEIQWQERSVDESDKFPILNSIEDSDSVILQKASRLPDHSTGRSWMHRI